MPYIIIKCDLNVNKIFILWPPFLKGYSYTTAAICKFWLVINLMDLSKNSSDVPNNYINVVINHRQLSVDSICSLWSVIIYQIYNCVQKSHHRVK